MESHQKYLKTPASRTQSERDSYPPAEHNLSVLWDKNQWDTFLCQHPKQIFMLLAIAYYELAIKKFLESLKEL